VIWKEYIMTTIKAFIKRHPVLTYFVLTFVISWGGFILVVGPSGFPGTPEDFATLMPFVALAVLVGPSVAGILMTSLVHGRTGLRELLACLRRWRVGALWYAVALLTAPLLYMAILPGLSLLSAEFVPGIFASVDKATLLLSGIVGGLVVSIFEEIGWTGFAVPMLRRRYGVLATGLIVGLLWAAWHWLGQIWAPAASSGTFSLTILLLDPFFFMVAYRVLMVWVYNHSGSLLVAILMHMALTASALILNPAGFAATAGWPLLTFDLVWAGALWLVVAMVAVTNGGHLSRPGKPPANVERPNSYRIDPQLGGVRGSH
jgi:uncharacterized protein